MVLFQRCLARALGQRTLGGSQQRNEVRVPGWACTQGARFGSAEPGGCRSHSRAAAGNSGAKERTLIAVKPDGVQRRLVGHIVQRFEQKGFKLVGLKMLKAPEEVLSQHYHDLRKKPFYPLLLHYMSSGPVVIMVWEGHNVVSTSRKMVGDTNPAEAHPGTIRGDFSLHISRNVVHASDSLEGAQREIQLWFNRNELMDWDSCDQSNVSHV
ncbi:nucleoside diphosphate kinase-like isoform X1 [Scleropages formosus]|uniref:Nucleoside diphosphate kinase n=1 Tax=Scleropages formosus TaxID=113540 RepID=A0A8C9V688_SCLFO|nr:nucleoside diphosphate kinase, mitochondrial isoform X1 [Scleropages formosus]